MTQPAQVGMPRPVPVPTTAPPATPPPGAAVTLSLGADELNSLLQVTESKQQRAQAARDAADALISEAAVTAAAIKQQLANLQEGGKITATLS